MGASRIRIERLHLTVTGVTREQAARLAADVARRVAATLSDADLARARGVGALRISLNTRSDPTDDRLAERIAGAITRSLA